MIFSYVTKATYNLKPMFALDIGVYLSIRQATEVQKDIHCCSIKIFHVQIFSGSMVDRQRKRLIKVIIIFLF